MIDTLCVKAGRAPFEAVDFVAFLEEEFGEIGAILAGDAGDERAFHRLHLTLGEEAARQTWWPDVIEANCPACGAQAVWERCAWWFRRHDILFRYGLARTMPDGRTMVVSLQGRRAATGATDAGPDSRDWG